MDEAVVWNFLLSAFGAVASGKYGRCVLWFLSTSLMILFLSMDVGIIIVLSGLRAETGLANAGMAVVPIFFLVFGAYDIGYAPRFLSYPAEIVPYETRAKGLAVVLAVDSLACFANQYVNPVAFTRMGWKYHCVDVGCLFSFWILILLLFPETIGG